MQEPLSRCASKKRQTAREQKQRHANAGVVASAKSEGRDREKEERERESDHSESESDGNPVSCLSNRRRPSRDDGNHHPSVTLFYFPSLAFCRLATYIDCKREGERRMHASASADWKERERAIKGKEAEREGERVESHLQGKSRRRSRFSHE